MNLIIAFTPLQILTALKIIEKHSDEDFYGVVLASSWQTKTIEYAKILEQKCREFQLIYACEKPGRIIKYADILRWIYYGLKIPQVDTLYMCNVDMPQIRLLLSRQKKAKFISFDDGSRNLVNEAIQNLEYIGRFYKSISKIFKIPSAQDLLDRQIKHYSIYPYPNNMGPSEYLPLFTPNQENNIRVFNEEESILLGQPIYEREYRSADMNIAFTERVIKNYHITKYFPHPRENYHISDVEYINTPLIIEDYLIQKLKEHPERKYIIYSYCSTAVLNLQGVSNQIEFVLLQPNDTPDFLKEIYNLFSKLGFSITQLPYGANDLIQGQD
jgi:beta-galactoside alpha-2,3-sialyltransferase